MTLPADTPIGTRIRSVSGRVGVLRTKTVRYGRRVGPYLSRITVLVEGLSVTGIIEGAPGQWEREQEG